jgi:hypothetical protein
VDSLRAGGAASWSAPDDPLLHALEVRCSAGLPAAVPRLRAALSELDSRDPRELWAGGLIALELGEEEAADTLTGRSVRAAAQPGQLAMLPDVLAQRIVSRVYAGALGEAEVLVRQLAAVCRRIGVAEPAYPAGLLAAWAGTDENPRAGTDENPRLEQPAGGDLAGRLGRAGGADLAARPGPAGGADFAGWPRPSGGTGFVARPGTDAVRAVLLNGLGRFEEAHAAAATGDTWPVLVERLVAAGRLGRKDIGGLRLLTEIARAAGSDGLLGLAAVSWPSPIGRPAASA